VQPAQKSVVITEAPGQRLHQLGMLGRR
jgi:hypothetical protein